MRYFRNISNTTGLQAFQLYRYAILLLIGILFTKSYLSTSEIGIYESLIFIASALTFFWIAGISQSLLSLYKDPGRDNKSDAFFNSFLLMSGFSLLAFVILRIFIHQFSDYFNLPDSVHLVKLISVYMLFASPSYLLEYIYLLKNQPKKLISYGLISYTLQLFLVVLPVFLDYPLIMAVRGLVLIAFLRFVWLIIILLKNSRISFNLSFIKEHLHLGLPLILSTMLSGAGVYIDGLIISEYFDAATFAVFKYGAKEFPLFFLLATAFSNSMILVIKTGEKLEYGLKMIKEKSLKMMHFLFPLAVILVLTSHVLYPFIFNENFIESASVFNIYILLLIFRLVFPQTLIIGLRKTKTLFYFSIVEVVVNVGVSLMLIRSFGIMGVAFGTIVAYFIEKALLVIYIKTKLKIAVTKYIPVFALTAYSVVLIVFFLLVEVFL